MVSGAAAQSKSIRQKRTYGNVETSVEESERERYDGNAGWIKKGEKQFCQIIKMGMLRRVDVMLKKTITSDAPPEKRGGFGRKLLAITLSLALICTSVSAVAFATDSDGADASVVAGQEGIAGEGTEAVVELTVQEDDEAIETSGAAESFGAQIMSFFSPRALTYFYVQTQQFGSTLQFSWDDIENAVRYTVERAFIIDDVVQPYELLASQPETSFTDYYLEFPLEAHQYRVWYRYTAYTQNGSVAAQLEQRIFVERAEDEVLLDAVAVGPTSIYLFWDPVLYGETYTVYRSLSERGFYEPIGTSTGIDYVDDTCTPEVPYFYRVIATDDLGYFIAESKAVSAQTAYPIPYAVDAETLSDSSIKVTWTPVDDVDGYVVYRSTTPDGVYEEVGTPTGAEFTDTGLTSNTDYYYKVAVSVAGGVGPKSDPPAHAKTLATVPGKTLGVTATALSTSSIKVDWNPVSDATGYYIYSSLYENGSYQLVGISPTNTFTNTGLNADTEYFYKVAAYNTYGTGQISDFASARTLKITVPSAPLNVTATALSTSSIQVKWNAVSDATGYYVYRSYSPTGGVYIGTTTGTSLLSTGLASDTGYYYVVVAYNAAGMSQLSNYAYAKTFKAGPSIPINVKATALSSSSIQVSWSAASGASGYYVYRSLTANGSYVYVGTSTSTSMVNSGLAADTGYYYKVAAYNSSGTSALSAYAYAKTFVNRATPTYPLRVTIFQQYYMSPSIYLGPTYPAGVSSVELWCTSSGTSYPSSTASWSRCFVKSVSQSNYLADGYRGKGYYMSGYTLYGGSKYYHFKYRFVYTDGTYSGWSGVNSVYPAQGMSGY